MPTQRRPGIKAPSAGRREPPRPRRPASPWFSAMLTNPRPTPHKRRRARQRNAAACVDLKGGWSNFLFDVRDPEIQVLLAINVPPRVVWNQIVNLSAMGSGHQEVIKSGAVMTTPLLRRLQYCFHETRDYGTQEAFRSESRSDASGGPRIRRACPIWSFSS